ncbi:F0F1 ATP synthase subunit B [Blattabacterium cuenoti]|uniref:F0F1 ATP synthase subunit B n=1 Tax=Blattabacterium cuenoti TaxID=1653831 RepID=UPI00163C0948|nr:F0F1 ATP synthase subunit B [Blattabacterium cuenoti]
MDLVTPSIGLIVWHSIIFIMLILFLSKFAWNPIINFIDQREEKIRKSIQKANQIQKELQEVKKKKDKILKETQIKRDIILEEAIQMREKIRLKAKKEGILEKKKIIEETKKDIHIKRKVAIQKLKNEIGDISIQIAEKILKKKLDHIHQQDKFIKKLVDKL